ncbi:MAG: hypothetical protein V3R33_06015 [Anaerolineales bacterium]
MKVYGKTSLHEILGDLIVYRNLDPVNSQLPRLDEIKKSLAIPAGKTPRKGQPAYAGVVVQLLEAAANLVDPNSSIQQLVYLGDTQLNDGNAFLTICNAGDWPGIAFIAAENQKPPTMELVEQGTKNICLANRWSALEDFEDYCRTHDFHIGKGTAVIVDLDKTALGARGRNDHVINQARVDAVRLTVGNFLGRDFDLESFQITYDLLNQPAFHSFTTDNQDYLAYICLILGSDLYEQESLINKLGQEGMETFDLFIQKVNDQAEKLSPELRNVHNSVYENVQLGDPTPFKAFRYQEYLTTTSRMGCQGDWKTVSELLSNEIVITQEIREAALRWKREGALLFGLSDKPDEACFPGKELAVQGHLPIHCLETYVVGE